MPEIMDPALEASMIMSPLHCLFGLHIVRRGVIFIDLAVAQVAALGTAFAMAGGNEPTSSAAYWMSLVFGMLAGLVIALTRFKLKLVPHEAIIGIVFVVGSAWSIIVLNGTAHGLEEMQSMLVGNILTVDAQQIRETAYIYTGILVVLIALWKYFTEISLAKGEKADIKTIFFDFVFYSLLALMVASSVKLAGVLLVFTWLVMPPVAAFLWVRKLGHAVAIALPLAILGSLLGLWVSFGKDWPIGATMVVCFGAIVAVLYVIRLIVPDKNQVENGT